jgi:drug/metabolite transporter (DMT)-like permease
MAQTTHSGLDRGDDVRRAKPLGLLVTLLGTVLLFISIFFDWVGLGQEDNEAYFRSGYESDSVIPFMALLGVGFSAALIYAMMKADRRQHRGLTLASFAVGLASFLWILFFLFDPISTVQYGGASV